MDGTDTDDLSTPRQWSPWERLGRVVRRAHETWKVRGARGLLRLLRDNLMYELRWFLDRRFDRIHGTDTSGLVDLAHLDIVGNRSDCIYFEPTSPKLFRRMISRVERALPLEDCTFVDLGSGKGRTLMLASDYPWKAIVGVEFARELHEVAVRNLRTYASRRQRCFEVSSVLADASLFEPPPGDLVLFMYSPFRGEAMERALANLSRVIQGRQVKVALVYFNPLMEYMIEACGLFCRREEVALPHDWARATQRKCIVYYNWRDAPGLDIAFTRARPRAFPEG